MSVKLLTEHDLNFRSVIGGCTDSSESTLVKRPHCLKSHAMAHIISYPDAVVHTTNFAIIEGSFTKESFQIDC